MTRELGADERTCRVESDPPRVRRETIAYHEAGHAVVALALRIQVRQAVIPSLAELEAGDPDREVLGFVECGAPPEGMTDWCEVLHRHVAVKLAGERASRRAGRPDRFLAGADLDEMKDLLRGLPGFLDDAQRRAWIDLGMALADEVLEAQWPAVEAVAKKLIERGRMTGPQLRRRCRLA